MPEKGKADMTKITSPTTCLVCGTKLPEVSLAFCQECTFPCELTTTEAPPADLPNGTLAMLDFKSVCCNADIDILPRKATCSPECHEMFVRRCEKELGEYRKVISITRGMAYKVPTRVIIEQGIREQDLPRFPLWS